MYQLLRAAFFTVADVLAATSALAVDLSVTQIDGIGAIENRYE